MQKTCSNTNSLFAKIEVWGWWLQQSVSQQCMLGNVSAGSNATVSKSQNKPLHTVCCSLLRRSVSAHTCPSLIRPRQIQGFRRPPGFYLPHTYTLPDTHKQWRTTKSVSRWGALPDGSSSVPLLCTERPIQYTHPYLHTQMHPETTFVQGVHTSTGRHILYYKFISYKSLYHQCVE